MALVERSFGKDQPRIRRELTVELILVLTVRYRLSHVLRIACKAKNFIDTAVYRGGDALSAWVKRMLDLLGEHPSLALFIGAGIALAWAGTGLALGRAQRRREAAAE